MCVCVSVCVSVCVCVCVDVIFDCCFQPSSFNVIEERSQYLAQSCVLRFLYMQSSCIQALAVQYRRMYNTKYNFIAKCRCNYNLGEDFDLNPTYS